VVHGDEAVNKILTIAGNESRIAMRNRWVVSGAAVLALLALSLALLGSAPTGTVGVAPFDVTIVSLTSLTIFLVPLLALLLSHDAIVGESERGTLLLLLAYPVARWQVIAGKFIGHTAVLAAAIVLGYGSAAIVIGWSLGGIDAESARAFAAMIASSVLLGASFLAVGYLVSAAVRQRGAAVGIAVIIWLVLVVIYDAALLGLLVADKSRTIPAGLVHGLLLFNPTDAFRLYNFGSIGRVGTLSGMAAVASQTQLTAGTVLSALAAWVAVPLLFAVVFFRRKQI
jgi:Cu-processing system permease protein